MNTVYIIQINSFVVAHFSFTPCLRQGRQSIPKSGGGGGGGGLQTRKVQRYATPKFFSKFRYTETAFPAFQGAFRAQKFRDLRRGVVLLLA